MFILYSSRNKKLRIKKKINNLRNAFIFNFKK